MGAQGAVFAWSPTRSTSMMRIKSKSPTSSCRTSQNCRLAANSSHARDARPVVLILYHRPMLASDVKEIAAALIELGCAPPYVLCPAPFLLARLPPDLVSRVRIVDWGGQPVAPTAARARSEHEGESAAGWLSALSLLGIVRLGVFLLKAIRVARKIARLLDRLRPDVVVTFDDRIPIPDMLLIRAARRRGSASILVPFAISATDADVFLRRGDPNVMLDRAPSRFLKAWIGLRRPAFVQATDRGAMLFYPPWESLGLMALGLDRHRPWTWGGGEADAVCTFGPHWQRMLVQDGAPPGRMVPTGQPSLDELHRLMGCREATRKSLASRFGLDLGGPVVIATAPHLAEHRISSWERHWADTDKLFAALAGASRQVLMSLHPLSDPDQYRGVAARYGIHLLDRSLMQALPAADCFVAHYSSTIRWALLLGLPSIIIDQVSFNYRMYDGVPGVRFVTSELELRSTLARVVEDADFRRAWCEQAKSYARGYELFDGRAAERVARLICSRALAARAR